MKDKKFLCWRCGIPVFLHGQLCRDCYYTVQNETWR